MLRQIKAFRLPHFYGHLLLPINIRTDVLTVEGPGDIAWNHAIDDLDRFDHFAVLDNFQARPFDDQIIQIAVHKILAPISGINSASGSFLGSAV